MTERTSSLCVSHAMQGFMQREVTVGMGERMNLMSDGHDSRLHNFFNLFCNDSRDGHFAKGRGGSNLCGQSRRATVPPLRVYFLRF